jgi:hypothetical protein
MGKRKDYFTRQKANAGIKVAIPDPVTGEASGEYVLVAGTDSDQVRALFTELARERAASEDKQDVQDENLRMCVAAVIGWSFTDALTPENVRETLVEIPALYDAIRAAIVDRDRFFGKMSGSSATSPDATSS